MNKKDICKMLQLHQNNKVVARGISIFNSNLSLYKLRMKQLIEIKKHHGTYYNTSTNSLHWYDTNQVVDIDLPKIGNKHTIAVCKYDKLIVYLPYKQSSKLGEAAAHIVIYDYDTLQKLSDSKGMGDNTPYVIVRDKFIEVIESYIVI